MKTTQTLFRTMTYAMVCAFVFIACDDTQDAIENQPEGTIQFGFNGSTQGRTSADGTPSAILLSIGDGTGNVHYEREVIELYPFNNSFISNSLSLPAGDYLLTEFFVLNDLDEVLFAAPKEGSEMAEFVYDPLSIAFSIEAGESSTIHPEVLSIENTNPEDFGLVAFGFDVIEVYKRIVGALIATDEGLQLTTAKLTIRGGNYDVYPLSWEKQVYLSENDSSNIVLIKGGLERYELTFEKEGYRPYTTYYTLEEMRGIESIYAQLTPIEELVRLAIDFGSLPLDSAVVTLFDGADKVEKRLEFSGAVASVSFDTIPEILDINIIAYVNSGFFLYPGQENAGYITHEVYETDVSVALIPGGMVQFTGPGQPSGLEWKERLIEEHLATGINYTFSSDMCDPYAALDLNGNTVLDGYIDLFVWDKPTGEMVWSSWHHCLQEGVPQETLCDYTAKDNLFELALNPNSVGEEFPTAFCQSGSDKLLDSIVMLYTGDEADDLLVFAYIFDNGVLGIQNDQGLSTTDEEGFKERIRSTRSNI